MTKIPRRVYILLTIVLLGIGFFGYKLYRNNVEKEIFEKNIQCQLLLEQFKNEYKSDVFQERDNHEIFYSPVENICVGTYRILQAYSEAGYGLVKIGGDHYEYVKVDGKCYKYMDSLTETIDNCGDYHQTLKNEINNLKK